MLEINWDFLTVSIQTDEAYVRLSKLVVIFFLRLVFGRLGPVLSLLKILILFPPERFLLPKSVILSLSLSVIKTLLSMLLRQPAIIIIFIVIVLKCPQQLLIILIHLPPELYFQPINLLLCLFLVSLCPLCLIFHSMYLPIEHLSLLHDLVAHLLDLVCDFLELFVLVYH